MPRTTFTNRLSRVFARRPALIPSQRKRSLLRFEALEERLAPALAVPKATLSFPAEVLIGEPAHASVTFANSGIATGYGPYIDLLLPASGAGGNTVNSM